jgi:hypothetical protein
MCEGHNPNRRNPRQSRRGLTGVARAYGRRRPRRATTANVTRPNEPSAQVAGAGTAIRASAPGYAGGLCVGRASLSIEIHPDSPRKPPAEPGADGVAAGCCEN